MDHTVLPAITPMPAFTSQAFTRWRLPRLRLRISNCSLLLIYLPRKDESLSRPGWLTYSGRFTHISGHPSAVSRAQDSESSPVKDRRSTNCATQPTNLHLYCTTLLPRLQYNTIEHCEYVRYLFIGFSKEFDVEHSVLLSKLSQLDLPPYVLNWIVSFLTCRSRVIKCGNSVSLPLNINQLILQGSGVGPTL